MGSAVKVLLDLTRYTAKVRDRPQSLFFLHIEIGVFVFSSLTDTLFPKKEMATDHPYDGCITVSMKYKFCSDG